MLDREIVSFRSCVRTRGLVAEWNWISKEGALFSPFPSCPAELSLLPSPHPQTAYPTLIGLIGMGYQYLSKNMNKELCKFQLNAFKHLYFIFIFNQGNPLPKPTPIPTPASDHPFGDTRSRSMCCGVWGSKCFNVECLE